MFDTDGGNPHLSDSLPSLNCFTISHNQASVRTAHYDINWTKQRSWVQRM